MFTGSTKLPPAKTPQPERLDEVYAALRRGLQWVNTFRLCLHWGSPSGRCFSGDQTEHVRVLLPSSGRTCRSTSWSWRVWASRSERTRGMAAWWGPVQPAEASLADAAQSSLLIGCFVMLSCPSFCWQGSLYEQDKVSFSGGCRLAEKSFRPVFNGVVFLRRAASEGHREVHAPLGVPSQQGVCVCVSGGGVFSYCPFVSTCY